MLVDFAAIPKPSIRGVPELKRKSLLILQYWSDRVEIYFGGTGDIYEPNELPVLVRRFRTGDSRGPGGSLF